ncbi:recombinase [Clostridium sp. WCA-389-WT-23D1]|uniref:Recombinase n=1 Tax=Clostridium porci TaxID=2605778 RepID=A0A7X2NP48_9CLOT|nr:recombinase [Clostridium porci]
MGYKVINGKIEAYEEHKKLVQQIFTDYDNGISAWKIAKDLKEMGISNAKGRVAWTHATVGRILENHNYLGTEYYPQIIEPELFDRVQKKREQVRIDGGRGTHRPSRKEILLFSGMLVCGECGSTCSHIQSSHKKEGYGVPKWKCKNYVYQNKVSCRGGQITDRQAEEVCIKAINSLIQNPGLIEKYRETEQTVSAEYRRLNRALEERDVVDADASALTPDEITALIFQRAEERYRTLKVRDESINAEEMAKILQGMEEITELTDDLHRKLIQKILVYQDNTVEVIFHNNNRIKMGYGQEEK